jgi:trigger factor
MDAVVNKEKLEVTNDELDEELNKTAEQYKMAREEFEKEIGSVELFKYDMLVKKAMKIITE